MKKIVQNLVVAAIAILLCLLFAEAAARCTFHFVANYDYEMWRYAAMLKQPLPTAGLPFRHRPSQRGNFYGVEVRTNSLGMRGPELTRDKPAGRKRIVVLGDSYTLGWGVAEEATFSRQLEQMLNRDNKVAEVINMGVGNYNSAMEVELFKAEGLPLDPDLVVLMYYINDLEPTPALGSFSYWLQKHCYLLGFMRSKLKQLQLMGAGPDWLSSYYRQIYAADAPGRQQNSRSLRELVRICQERNIRLLMVNIPDLRRLEHYPFAYATEYIRGLAAENRVPFLDLLPVLEKYPGKALWVSAEDSHANGKANRLVGEALFNMIKADSLLSAR